MINQIKLGIKLLKYGLSYKLQLVWAVVFLVYGFGMEITEGGSSLIGGFYIMLSCMFIFQIIISLDVSTMVQTSPYKKKIQTTMPILTCTPVLLAAYTVVVLIVLGTLSRLPAEDAAGRSEAVTSLIGISCLLFVCSVYFGVCYKYYLAATAVMFAAVFGFTVFFVAGEHYSSFAGWDIPLAPIVLIGYLLIPLGQLLASILSRLVYKKELSNFAFRAAMRRESR